MIKIKTICTRLCCSVRWGCACVLCCTGVVLFCVCCMIVVFCILYLVCVYLVSVLCVCILCAYCVHVCVLCVYVHVHVCVRYPVEVNSTQSDTPHVGCLCGYMVRIIKYKKTQPLIKLKSIWFSKFLLCFKIMLLLSEKVSIKWNVLPDKINRLQPKKTGKNGIYLI